MAAEEPEDSAGTHIFLLCTGSSLSVLHAAVEGVHSERGEPGLPRAADGTGSPDSRAVAASRVIA